MQQTSNNPKLTCNRGQSHIRFGCAGRRYRGVAGPEHIECTRHHRRRSASDRSVLGHSYPVRRHVFGSKGIAIVAQTPASTNGRHHYEDEKDRTARQYELRSPIAVPTARRRATRTQEVKEQKRIEQVQSYASLYSPLPIHKRRTHRQHEPEEGWRRSLSTPSSADEDSSFTLFLSRKKVALNVLLCFFDTVGRTPRTKPHS
jgi:hypothetical protein